jgi:hypothetical protein
MPNVLMGRTMRCIPTSKLTAIPKTTREGDAKQAVMVTLCSTKHALLRNPHVDRKCGKDAQDGACQENLPKPEFT